MLFIKLFSLSEKCHKEAHPLHFYSKYEPYYEFSNFYEYTPFKLDGKEWKSTEHYFQTQKFAGTPYEEYIRVYASIPRRALELSRESTFSQWQRKHWEDIKQAIMYKALLAKFTEHVWLRLLLDSTANRELVEHTYMDSYWGDGGDGTGHNHLGKLLKRVRSVMRAGEKKIILHSDKCLKYSQY